MLKPPFRPIGGEKNFGFYFLYIYIHIYYSSIFYMHPPYPPFCTQQGRAIKVYIYSYTLYYIYILTLYLHRLFREIFAPTPTFSLEKNSQPPLYSGETHFFFRKKNFQPPFIPEKYSVRQVPLICQTIPPSPPVK